ncbi:nuclease-related domain-containing protein [Actinocorallia longicatena]|uniref:NERD domain-containing protein n=1 Tax=Actinocorallia longicatena TaxID=111803 RepID=A0ABP6QF03_9ACTN
MTELQVTPWRRYGRFRLYVKRAEQDLGWYAPDTGEHHLAPHTDPGPFWTAVAAECARLAVPPPATALPAPEPEPAPETAPEPEREPAGDLVGDLAGNAAGSSARAEAERLRRLRPVRELLARILRIRTDAAAFAYGARGEEKVGRALGRWAAREGWHVLHSVPVGRRSADIDHVLVGPFGVVTLNTKRTRGKVRVSGRTLRINGYATDYLRNSRHEGARAAKLLAAALGGEPPPVVAAIVFAGTGDFAVREGGPRDMAVLGDVRALRGWLRSRPRLLTDAQVERVHAVARRPGTWRP